MGRTWTVAQARKFSSVSRGLKLHVGFIPLYVGQFPFDILFLFSSTYKVFEKTMSTKLLPLFSLNL